MMTTKKKRKPGAGRPARNGATKAFYMRMPLEVDRKLEELARLNRRSKAMEAVVAIEKGLNAKEC